MIKKNKWEKSFRNINGRMPTEEEYKEAVSEGLVQDEDSKDILDRKKIIIIGCVISGLLVIAITILLIIFFYPKPTNQQATFNTSSIESSSSTSSSSTIQSSSSSKKELQNMDNLDLNTKVAVLAQAYFALNPSTTILQTPNLAMSNSWDNGPIEWYDNQGAKHKLNVRVNGDTITYDYIDATTGNPTTQTASVDESITRYLLPTNAIRATEQIAAKVVAPANLKPNDGKTGGAKGEVITLYPPRIASDYTHLILATVPAGYAYLQTHDYIIANTSSMGGGFPAGPQKRIVMETSSVLPNNYIFFWVSNEVAQELGDVRIDGEIAFYSMNNGNSPLAITKGDGSFADRIISGGPID